MARRLVLGQGAPDWACSSCSRWRPVPCTGQSPLDAADEGRLSLEARLEHLEQRYAALAEENHRLSTQIEQWTERQPDFIPGSRNLKFTIDAAWINHSPAEQNRTDYRAGDIGFLFRTQIQSFF